MTIKGVGLSVLCAIMVATAQVLLRVAVRKVSFSISFSSIWALTKEPTFWLFGLISAVACLVWLRVVATEPLGMAYPIFTTCSFALMVFGLTISAGMSIGVYHILGTLLIFGGLLVLGLAAMP